MGFETERVKGGQDPNGILQEFICSICQGLIALDSVRTACHHLFCRHCLEEWLTKDRGSKIPRTSTNVGLHRQISAHDACPVSENYHDLVVRLRCELILLTFRRFSGLQNGPR